MNIPEGHQTVMPHVVVDGAEKFRDYIKSVFDAKITYESASPDRSLGHCEAQIGESTIMFAGSGGPWGPRTSDIFVYVENADRTYKKGLDEGATTVMEVADQNYGRSGGVTDPLETFGGSRQWSNK